MRSLLLSLTMFTAIPLRTQVLDVDRTIAARALLWLPAVGAALGVVAAGPLLLARLADPGAAGGLLGAVLAIAVLAVLTSGLHLDGLADTIDGLGSRAPAERALEIMRQSDIGAFGVAALVLSQLLKVCALAAVGPTAAAVAALVLAELTGRVGIVLAAGPGVPSARPEGFGALVAGSVGALRRALLVAAAAGLTVLLGWFLAGGLWLLLAVGAGLAAAVWWRRRIVRRLGGVTGDVFGSVAEVGSTIVLLAAALLPIR
ncbi:adenosylcobinamide-GDP ribazoletransferase [Flindersiella endophytica]